MYLRIGLLLGCLIVGCSHWEPTPFEKGLTIEGAPATEQTSTFSGNSSTPQSRAKIFSQVGAINACLSQDKLALFIDTTDSTYSHSYTQVSSSSYTSPGYSSFQGKTYRDYSKDRTYTNVYSYPVTNTYPIFSTTFWCLEKARLTAIPKTEEISRELVHPYTADFQGGLLVTHSKKTFQKGDVLVRLNGIRITSKSDLRKAMFSKRIERGVPVKLVRSGKLISIFAPVIEDASIDLLVRNLTTLQDACKLRRMREAPIPNCDKTVESWVNSFEGIFESTPGETPSKDKAANRALYAEALKKVFPDLKSEEIQLTR